MNKFNLEARVALTKTQDNLLGTVIGIYSHLKYLYVNPMYVMDMAGQWAKIANTTREDILEQNVYIIKLDKGIIPGNPEEAQGFRDKFPDQESFEKWIEGHRTDRMSTFEDDIILSSDLVPDSLPEGI